VRRHARHVGAEHPGRVAEPLADPLLDRAHQVGIVEDHPVGVVDLGFGFAQLAGDAVADAGEVGARGFEGVMEARDLLLAMLSPKSDVADVYSPDDNTAAIGRLIWNDEQKRVWFVADNLPARPANQTYQIWVSSGGKYTSLGTFAPDATGFARYVAIVPQGMKSYDTAVVTIEEAGGASQRSGPFVFSANLSRFQK
jgi:hypothetical protein